MTTKPFTARLRLADEARQRYYHVVDAGAAIDDVLDRKTWVHVAKQLRAGDIVEIETEDHVWDAEIRVIHVEITETGVHIPSFALLRYTDLEKAQRTTASPGAYRVEFKGAAKFAIIRNADKEVIERGIPTKAAAEARAAELEAA